MNGVDASQALDQEAQCAVAAQQLFLVAGNDDETAQDEEEIHDHVRGVVIPVSPQECGGGYVTHDNKQREHASQSIESKIAHGNTRQTPHLVI
jgi:hypothetical protein